MNACLFLVKRLNGLTMKKWIVACMFAIASVTAAHAQGYPSRPITMVVPFPAGSAFDVAARVLAEGMQAALGQPVIVEDVTGAAGSIGTGRVARAAPDGYVLCFGGLITHVINGAVLSLPYDVVNDFEPVSLIATTELVVVARKTMPANDLKGLIDWIRASPDKASQGSGGQGSLTHVAGVFFQMQTDTRFNIVPYRGAAGAINDLVAGHIDFMFDLLPNSLPHMRTGAIKSYAVMAKTRLATAPDVPTVDEAGLPGFYMSAWQAMWVPKNTPQSVVNKLNAAVVHALADPALRSRLESFGEQIYPREQQTPQSLAAFHKAELEKWWPIVKATNIKGKREP
jgi:tripartite-type tricarboxylate transporter receptor subunit TctC